MPCFMNNHHGFRPAELDSIRARGLINLARQWSELDRLGRPNIRNPVLATKLNQTFSTVHQSVVSYFRSEDTRFESDKVLSLLSELRQEANDELNRYASRLESFVIELARATKS